MSASTGYSIEASNWRPASDTVRDRVGYVDLLIGPLGLKLYDTRIIRTPDGLRVAFTSRPTVAGRELRRHPDGGIVYERVLGFPAHGAWTAFSAVAVEAVERTFPGALSQTPTSIAA